jgi:hypothetical protein
MAMDLDAAIYLQRNGMLTSAKNKVLDIGTQNIYNARDGQIREFVINQSSTADPVHLESEINRLVVHHSDFDVLIPSHSRIGKVSGGTMITMLLGTPG